MRMTTIATTTTSIPINIVQKRDEYSDRLSFASNTTSIKTSRIVQGLKFRRPAALKTHRLHPRNISNRPLHYLSMPKAKASKLSASKASKPTSSSSATAPPPPPPSWPVFKPPLPLTDLEPETLLDDRVALIRNFWPKSLCRDYVSFLRSLPLTTTPGKPKRGEAVRVNDRFQVQDQRFADRLWSETGLREVLLGEEYQSLW